MCVANKCQPVVDCSKAIDVVVLLNKWKSRNVYGGFNNDNDVLRCCLWCSCRMKVIFCGCEAKEFVHCLLAHRAFVFSCCREIHVVVSPESAPRRTSVCSRIGRSQLAARRIHQSEISWCLSYGGTFTGVFLVPNKCVTYNC